MGATAPGLVRQIVIAAIASKISEEDRDITEQDHTKTGNGVEIEMTETDMGENGNQITAAAAAAAAEHRATRLGWRRWWRRRRFLRSRWV